MVREVRLSIIHREAAAGTANVNRHLAIPNAHSLPRSAELQALRDHLQLLAQLSIPEHQHPDSLVLPRTGLAHCFTHLADTADRIVAAVAA